MQTLYIIRGLPGSGKTTLAQNMIRAFAKHGGGTFVHAEADQFFTRPDGEYEFRREMLKDAHAYCQGKVFDALQNGVELVIVSNTFVKKWEMQPYIDMANNLKIEYGILCANGNYQNVHGVPDETIARMRATWEG